jgi:hypothetical protein
MYKVYVLGNNFVIENDSINLYDEYNSNDVRVSKVNSDILYYDFFFNGEKKFSLPLRVLFNQNGDLYAQSSWDSFRFNSTGGDVVSDISDSIVKSYLYRNQNYLNGGSQLNVKAAGASLFYDISDSSTISARSVNDGLVIDANGIQFKDNYIYDLKVKMKLVPEVSNNHLELALAKDVFNVYDEATITTTKLEDARYEAEFNGFHYTADKGDVKLFVSKCVTGGSELNIHTINIVIKEIGENVA